MSQLRLDYQDNLPFPWTGLLLLLLVLMAATLTGGYYLKLKTQAAAYEASVQQSREKSHGLSGDVVESPTAAQEVSNANVVIRQLGVPWEALFQAVESTGGGKVTLLAISPDIEKRQVKITGEAKDYRILMKYLTRLEEFPVFGSVYLQNHHVQLQDPDRPVRFLLLANWQETP